MGHAECEVGAWRLTACRRGRRRARCQPCGAGRCQSACRWHDRGDRAALSRRRARVGRADQACHVPSVRIDPRGVMITVREPLRQRSAMSDATTGVKRSRRRRASRVPLDDASRSAAAVRWRACKAWRGHPNSSGQTLEGGGEKNGRDVPLPAPVAERADERNSCVGFDKSGSGGSRSRILSRARRADRGTKLRSRPQ